ncbi:MAG TPA: hypothetical protein VIU82_21880 [Bosea sp. (in: a-proteobacteria)]
MTSVVSICNLALSNLGKSNITDLAEATAEARACRQFYDIARDTMLQTYPWRFAGKTASLAELTNDKPGAWGHSYNRPNDCLTIRWVRPEYSLSDPRPVAVADPHSEHATPYEVDGGRIYCDLSPAFLRYTFRQSDPTRFSPLFIDALSWHLAVRLAMPMTRDPKVRADAYQLAMRTQAAAQVADANETRETSDHASELVTGRV